MPIYEYTCNKCNHVHDSMRPIDSRDSPIDCPECNHNECSRNITGAMGAVDTTLTADKVTGGQFSEITDRIKRGTPKQYHETLDRAANRDGGIWGNN